MGSVFCTPTQDEVLCCSLCCCRFCCPCYSCCCHLCCCCPCCCHHCSCCSRCCHLCCCCPCCPTCWLQCPPSGSPCSPGVCSETYFHPLHPPCHQPRPSCWCCSCPPCCCYSSCCRSCCCLRSNTLSKQLRQDNISLIL